MGLESNLQIRKKTELRYSKERKKGNFQGHGK